MKNAPLQSDFRAAQNFMRELAKVADRPTHLIETRLAELIRDLREAYALFFNAQTGALQQQLNIQVRQAATDLLVHLHASRGHPIPGVFAMPTKDLPELLNDLETVLFTEVVARDGNASDETPNEKVKP